MSAIRKVAIIDHTESMDGRVGLLKQFFEHKGFQADVIMSDFSHYKKEKITDKKAGYKYLHTIPYKKNLSLTRIASHVYFAKKVYKFLCKEDYDLVWVLLPPNYLLKEIVKAKRIKHFLLIGDVEDLWPESLPIHLRLIQKSFLFKQWQNLRNENLRYADYVVTECEAYLPYLKEYINLDKYSTLFLAKNAVKKIEFLPNRNNRILKIAYVGSINHIIDINVICKTVEDLSKFEKVEVIIIGDGENRQKLINSLNYLENVKVKYLGKIFDERKKQAILRECNMGLNIMKKSVVVGFTMKSLDYLKNGLFLINNIQNDTWNMVKDNGIGINVGSSDIDYKQIIDESFSLDSKNKIIDLYNNFFSKESFFNNLNEILKKIE